jgi:type IV secretory pathway VirD2 relaxase
MAMERSPQERSTFRPRVGGRGGQVPFQRAPRFCQSVLIRAHRRFVRVAGLAPARPPRKGGTRGVDDTLRPRADARRCVVKALIVKTGPRGVKAARLHLAYIERDGVERDGSEGRLYGPGEVVDRASVADVIPGERHQFRFIVSPEDDVDLTTFTRALMARVEDDLGVRLRWGAVNHYNTDNPHAHLVVRGIDQAGREVWIDRAYITERMRWQAQHLLTEELGPRPQHEIERQLDREIGQERLTSLDRKLAVVVAPDGTTDVARLAANRSDAERNRLVGRLQKLETLQLATRTRAGTWTLSPEWQAALRELGERGDIIKRIHRAMSGDGDPARYEVVDASVDRAPLEGVVRRKGLHDELRGDAYAVVETPRGKAAYVRLDAVTADALVEGSVVRITVEAQRWSKPIDRVLERVARESGGVYEASAHLQALRRRPVVIADRAIPPEEVVAANVRRLARLERYRLVTRLSEGRWRVPADLVSSLESRDASHPRRLVRAQTLAPSPQRQVTLRAPCWLDQQDPKLPRAPFGLGPALGRAMAERERFLAGLGIPRGPREQRITALERLERFDVCRRLATEYGATALPDPVPGMRGRMLASGQSVAGVPLVCVVDEANRRAVVVPLPTDARALVGRNVTVGRDASGRVVIRPHGLGKGLQ